MDMLNQGQPLARQNNAQNMGATKAVNSEFLTFRLDPEAYGLDILRVQEIRSYESPTRIAPRFIKGVVNVHRGVVGAVVDSVSNVLEPSPDLDQARTHDSISRSACPGMLPSFVFHTQTP